MEKTGNKINISIENFIKLLEAAFASSEISIVKNPAADVFSYPLYTQEKESLFLTCKKDADRKDLLIIENIVNLFKINIESDSYTSGSFSDSVIRKIGLFNNLVDNFPGIIAVMDFNGRYKFINKFVSENLNGKDWLEKKTSDLFTKEQKEQILEKNLTISQNGYVKDQDYFVDKKGRLRTFEKHSFLVQENGESLIVVLGIDVTEKAVLETKLNDLAYKDSLTGINNYNFFLKKTEELLKNNEKFSLIYIDIKKFRVINEIYGYEVGDKVLIHIVNLVNRFILKTGEINNVILTRFKDDEFIIVYKNITKENAVLFARELIDFLKQPIIINDIVYRLDLDIGISSFPEDGVVKETLIRKAALAKNKARLNNEVHLVSFSGDLEAEIKREYELESEIHDSLEKGEFELYLQPILDLNTEKIVKGEALIRWNHKKYGVVAPNDFIPVAEKSNLILKIGEWVLEEACKILKRWEYKNINIPISINISGKQLLQYNLPGVVEGIIKKYDVEPEKIVMEVTENYIFEEAEHLKDIIKRLNKIGIRFSIDDFGTGNSSMTKLKHINFAEIKIDRSFISGLLENKTDEHLVKSIITLAKDLELDVVAEGIEDLKQYVFLSNLGCKYIQGFLFSKPVKVREFEKLLPKKFDMKRKALKEFQKNTEEDYFCEPEDECEKIYCHLPIPVMIFDKNLKIRGFNPKFQELFKWEKKEITGKSLATLSTESSIKYLKKVISDLEISSDEVSIPLMKKGGVFLDTVITLDKGEEIIGIITQVKNQNIGVNLGYHEFLENLPNSILVTDINGNIEYVNKRFTHITGYKPVEVYGQNPRMLSSGLIPNEVFKNLWDTILSGREWQGELHNIKKNKETYWQSVRITPIFNNNKEIEKFVASIEDITEKKAYEKRLRYLAKIDPMTGALNRAAGMEFLDLFFDEGIISKDDITLIFLDLDNLKEINDKYGHGKGDEVIKIVAEIIQKNIRKDQLFIRYGGDEFLIVIRNNEEISYEFIINRISIDLQIRSRDFISPISLSFGVSFAGEVPNDNLEKMIKRADERMYNEKSSKKKV